MCSSDLDVDVLDRTIQGLSRSYGDATVGTLVALLGSSGRLEIAQVGGPASYRLGLGEGDLANEVVKVLVEAIPTATRVAVEIEVENWVGTADSADLGRRVAAVMRLPHAGEPGWHFSGATWEWHRSDPASKPCPVCGGTGGANGCGEGSGYEGPCHAGPYVPLAPPAPKVEEPSTFESSWWEMREEGYC